ncbi:MAG: VTT domain-containing protein [Nanoarchaeota archaeon]
MDKKENKYAFVYENSNFYKIRIFIFALVFILILLALIIAFRETLWQAAKQNNLIQSIVSLTRLKSVELNVSDLFFAGLLGGLFFILMPLEVMFYSSIIKGSSPLLSIFMMTSGFVLAQAINYYVGTKFSPLVMNFVSRKKVYSVRRFINKHGSYGIFLINLSPLPSEILTFALGLAKYNVYRMFMFVILGTLLKYLAIAGIALIF